MLASFLMILSSTLEVIILGDNTLSDKVFVAALPSSIAAQSVSCFGQQYNSSCHIFPWFNLQMLKTYRAKALTAKSIDLIK